MGQKEVMHYSDEFSLDPGIIYLNHAAVAPWPKRTVDAIERFSRENQQRGAQHYPRWLKTESTLRNQFRRLINAPSVDDIAILKNTSEALSVVAYGLTWRPGDNIVVCKQEFPSNRVIWESLQKFGVTITYVDLDGSDDPESLIIQHINKQTRLLPISAVQYGTGLRMDLFRLGEHCRKNNILFCIDAIQSLGAIPFDVQAVDADFVMADGHKWMLGPEGVALFYCRSTIRETLTLNQYGWHMLDRIGDYDAEEWEPARTARRFESGSPNMLGMHAMSASLSLLLDIGIEKVEQLVIEHSNLMIDLVHSRSNLRVLSDTRPARLSGIVTFAHTSRPAHILVDYLMQKNVICAARGGGVRFSPHFYTDPRCIENAIQLSAVTD